MRKIGIFLIGMLCLLTITPSAYAVMYITGPAEQIFKDVPEQSQFFDAVNYFSTSVPIINQDREYFKPLDKVTKAEFFKLLMASTGYTPLESGPYDIPFHDITGTEWFAPYIEEALNKEIISYSEENPNFSPGDMVTRAQGIKFTLDAYNFDYNISINDETGYLDVPRTSKYAQIAKFAYEMQLLNDYKSRQFAAENELTRAQTVHILYQTHVNNDFEMVTSATNTYGSQIDLTSEDGFLVMLEVWDKINNEYVDKDKIDQDELIYGAISGMVASLDDPYSVFFKPSEASDYKDSLDGSSFEGIGIYLNVDNDEIIIITPLKGSPAEEAGLKPNDKIIEVDGVSVNNSTLDEVVDMLRGPAGSSVKIKVSRNGTILIKTVIRTTIDVPYVESEVKNGIGVIYYNQFTNNSHAQFITQVESLTSQNVKGFVIDFRNNPGGYLSSAKQLVSHFLAKGETYAKLEFADGYTQLEKSNGPSDLSEYPVVIIINEGSASASEIAALALKELYDAPIVGETSFGKGKIQEIITYDDGSSLKLSTAKWLSPLGTYIDGIGITPDYAIELTDLDIERGNDPQLEKALQLVK